MKKGFHSNRIYANRGTTLVEMLVCFALLGILMVAAIQVLGSAMMTYQQVKQSSEGREVSKLIMDSIEGELASAMVDTQVPDIQHNNEEIFFYDKKNRPVRILNEGGYILFSYGRTAEESKWKFDPAVYKDYVVTDIHFAKVVDTSSVGTLEADDVEYLDPAIYAKDIYKVSVTLHHPKRGDYEEVRYISCRNMR